MFEMYELKPWRQRSWACTICGTGDGSSNRLVPPRAMVFTKAWTGFPALCLARNRCFSLHSQGRTQLRRRHADACVDWRQPVSGDELIAWIAVFFCTDPD